MTDRDDGMRVDMKHYGLPKLAIGLALLLAAGCSQSDSGGAASQSNAPAASGTASSGESDSVLGKEAKVEQLPDMTLGDPKAPVKIIEYASMTCPHCAHFDATVFPEIKKTYIDTGKVFYTFREYPLDGIALRASMVARCVGPDRFFSFVHGLFHTQLVWANPDLWSNEKKTIDEKFGPLATMAKEQAGMSRDDFDACIKNETLMQQITMQAKRGLDDFKVSGTPALYINGEAFAEFGSFDKVDAKLKEVLGGK
jgi:protein-disulfide isomerase